MAAVAVAAAARSNVALIPKDCLVRVHMTATLTLSALNAAPAHKLCITRDLMAFLGLWYQVLPSYLPTTASRQPHKRPALPRRIDRTCAVVVQGFVMHI